MLNRIVFAVALTAAASSSVSAQINPYAPPGPGWVIVQVCGQEAQWVPPSHPLALAGICATIPDPPTDGPTAPEVLQAGHVYRSRTYHLVIVVTSVTLTERYNFTTLEVERSATAETVNYQSEEAYRSRRGGEPGVKNPTDVWEWYEIAR